MPSLFDFNFTGDDPGPDTDPMLDNPDSQHDGEDDRANYEEPGRGLTFTGHDPTSFSGRGNAEEPTKQESDVPPIDMVALENEKSLAYWDKLWSDDESENETDEEFSQLQLGIEEDTGIRESPSIFKVNGPKQLSLDLDSPELDDNTFIQNVLELEEDKPQQPILPPVEEPIEETSAFKPDDFNDIDFVQIPIEFGEFDVGEPLKPLIDIDPIEKIDLFERDDHEFILTTNGPTYHDIIMFYDRVFSALRGDTAFVLDKYYLTEQEFYEFDTRYENMPLEGDPEYGLLDEQDSAIYHQTVFGR